MAENALQEGLSLNTIHKITGLSIERLQELQSELNMVATEWNLEDALEVREEETRETMAENALQEGVTIDFVHEISGLSIERIQELQSELTFSGANP